MEPSIDRDGNGLLDFARLQLRTIINEAREAVWNLRQPDNDTTDLAEKLESMAGKASTEFGVPVGCSITGTPVAISHPLAHDLLMVAREAVCNAAVHGNPAHVDIALRCNRRDLTLLVVDDGCGFDVREAEGLKGRHFGLKGMKERTERSGGKFRVISEPGKGVSIEACMPLHH